MKYIIGARRPLRKKHNNGDVYMHGLMLKLSRSTKWIPNASWTDKRQSEHEFWHSKIM